MGRVAGAYGVRGWVKVAPGRGVLQALVGASEWWIGGVAYTVAEARAHSASVLAKLQGLDSRERAMKLKGAAVEVRRSALPEAGRGHYYLADLLGLEVWNEQDQRLGSIGDWMSNGAQDVMQVEGERRYLIPWVAAVVKRVDLEARRVVVDWQADW